MRVTLTDRNPSSPSLHWFKGSESMLAGAGAGLVSSIVTCPLDVIKTKLQATGTSNSDGLRGIFTKIWRNEGFKGLYRGLGPTIVGYLPTWAIYFTVYDKVKITMGELRGSEDDPIAHIVAAMTAGATGTICTNPLWVIKTRFMTQKEVSPGEVRYRHTVDAIHRIYKTEGIRAFYRGMVPSLIGVSHIAVQFPMYEQLKVYYRPKDGSEISSSTILFCSSSSKMIASVATYPHEVLRTRLQIQKQALARTAPSTSTASAATSATSIAASTARVRIKPYKGIGSTFRKILREEGYRGFYSGMGVNLLRTVPASALTILTYEVMMRRLTALSHPTQHS